MLVFFFSPSFHSIHKKKSICWNLSTTPHVDWYSIKSTKQIHRSAPLFAHIISLNDIARTKCKRNIVFAKKKIEKKNYTIKALKDMKHPMHIFTIGIKTNQNLISFKLIQVLLQTHYIHKQNRQEKEEKKRGVDQLVEVAANGIKK